jgi:hypothetical protein
VSGERVESEWAWVGTTGEWMGEGAGTHWLWFALTPRARTRPLALPLLQGTISLKYPQQPTVCSECTKELTYEKFCRTWTCSMPLCVTTSKRWLDSRNRMAAPPLPLYSPLPSWKVSSKMMMHRSVSKIKTSNNRKKKCDDAQFCEHAYFVCACMHVSAREEEGRRGRGREGGREEGRDRKRERERARASERERVYIHTLSPVTNCPEIPSTHSAL